VKPDITDSDDARDASRLAVAKVVAGHPRLEPKIRGLALVRDNADIIAAALAGLIDEVRDGAARRTADAPHRVGPSRVMIRSLTLEQWRAFEQLQLEFDAARPSSQRQMASGRHR